IETAIDLFSHIQSPMSLALSEVTMVFPAFCPGITAKTGCYISKDTVLWPQVIAVHLFSFESSEGNWASFFADVWANIHHLKPFTRSNISNCSLEPALGYDYQIRFCDDMSFTYTFLSAEKSRTHSFNLRFILFSVHECFARMYGCVPNGCLLPEEDRRVRLMFRNWSKTVESYHMGAGNPTPVLCKGSL
ncbi:hypothetical protein STEG23_006519, partial [Scotinomys teguina]